MHGFFGEIQISEEAHQRRQNPARFRPVKGLNGLAESLGHRRRHLRQASKRHGSIHLRSGFPTRSSSALRSFARRQQAHYPQVTHRKGSWRMTRKPELSALPGRKSRNTADRLLIRLASSDRHSSTLPDQAGVKFPPPLLQVSASTTTRSMWIPKGSEIPAPVRIPPSCSRTIPEMRLDLFGLRLRRCNPLEIVKGGSRFRPPEPRKSTTG